MIEIQLHDALIILGFVLLFPASILSIKYDQIKFMGIFAPIAFSFLMIGLVLDSSINEEQRQDEMQIIKTTECDILKERIYNKNFTTMDDAIFEYEWRCEK